MKLDKSHPLHSKWSFPAQQLPACNSFPHHSMLVLDVNYSDKDIAKTAVGAQFEPISYMWFHNPDAPWNRSFTVDVILNELNTRKWFVGYGYTDSQPNPNVRYQTPLCAFTWLDTLFTAGYYRTLPTKEMFTTHSWFSTGLPVISIIIFKPNTINTAAYVVEYKYYKGKMQNEVNSMRQISIEGARELWDICCKCNEMQLTQDITGIQPDVLNFMEMIEVRAGVGAVAVQSAVAAYSNTNSFDPLSKQYFTNLPKVPGVQYKTAPNGASIPVNTTTNTNTNYALHA